MDDLDVTNLLLSFVCIAWVAKILFHYHYLKLIKKPLSNSNILSFFTSPENFFNILEVVSPVLLRGKPKTGANYSKERRKVWIFTIALWATFIVSGYYLYNHPQTNEPKKIIYDLTNP
jgi:hypothetical protein